METLETILTRRSVRKFKPDPIDAKTITTILRAAMAAPSAMNEQPWHFIVIDEKELASQVAAAHPYAKMCLEAPITIIPCIDESQLKTPKFSQQDLSAAVENLLLAIRDLGLGAVWCGVYPQEALTKAIAEIFSLPNNIKPFCVIPLGYSDVEQTQVNRYQEKRVHYNSW